MPKILWLPASEISHMEELGWKWKYGNKCPRNTPLSRLLCAIQSGLRKKCSSSKEAKVDRLIILYQKSTSHTLFSLLDKIIFNFFCRCKTFLKISGLSVCRVVDWNGWRRPLGCGINNNKLQWTGSNGGGFKFQKEIILKESQRRWNDIYAARYSFWRWAKTIFKDRTRIFLIREYIWNTLFQFLCIHCKHYWLKQFEYILIYFLFSDFCEQYFSYLMRPTWVSCRWNFELSKMISWDLRTTSVLWSWLWQLYSICIGNWGRGEGRSSYLHHQA